MSKEACDEIRSLQLGGGVGISPDTKRYYPFGTLLSQTIGFTSTDGTGQSGLELTYNKYLTGKDGVVEATHGGLECGLLMEKIPGLDAVSMGPELHDVHSVRERLNVPSTERTYELVCELLRRSC